MIRSRGLSTCLYQILPTHLRASRKFKSRHLHRIPTTPIVYPPKLKSQINKKMRFKVNRKSLNQKETDRQQRQKDPHLTYPPILRNSITSPKCLQRRLSNTQLVHAARVSVESSTVMESIQCAIIVNGMVAGVPMIDECDLVRLQGRSIRTESEERSRLPV